MNCTDRPTVCSPSVRARKRRTSVGSFPSELECRHMTAQESTLPPAMIKPTPLPRFGLTVPSTGDRNHDTEQSIAQRQHSHLYQSQSRNSTTVFIFLVRVLTMRQLDDHRLHDRGKTCSGTPEPGRMRVELCATTPNGKKRSALDTRCLRCDEGSRVRL